MSYVRFAGICDRCQSRSAEYSNWPHCRECGAHVCLACSTLPDEESGSAMCLQCARETKDDPIEGPDTRFAP